GAPATAAGTVPTNQTISANPVIAPQAPAPVASAAGQQALQGIANYTPPALAGYPNSSLPTVGSTPGSVPSINPNNSWIAVDPTNPGTTGTNGNTVSPTPVPAAAGGQEVKITTTDNGITTTVEVPAGQAAQINLDTTINND